MLAPRTSNAFVCFRCELQLAQRRLPAYARPSSLASFSTSARRHDGADELEALSQGPTTGPRIRREVAPLNRLRKRKGKFIRETSARLGGLKTLGDDADILVLREILDDKPVEPADKHAPAEPIAVPDIIASIQQEHRALTPEEIHERLESLRPKDRAEPGEPRFITTTAFVKLIQSVTHGFTQHQLAQYYSAAKNIQHKSYNRKLLDSLKVETGISKSLITRTEWQPGVRPIERRLPGVDVTSRLRRAPVSKQLLVDRIIRDLWKLVPLEEVEAPGEIELSLKPWHIALLNTGEHETILDKISRERKARIDLYQPHRVLRITADKSTAEYAANDVEEALQNTASKKLQLKPWLPCLEKHKVPEDKKLAALYTQADFDMVASLTRTSIQRMDNTNTLVIRGLGKSAVAEAERSLIRLLPFKDDTLYTIDRQKLDATKGSGHLVPASVDRKSLDHQLRSTQLGRWLFPVPKDAHLVSNNEHASDSHAKATTKTESAADGTRVARTLKSLQQSRNHGSISTPEETTMSRENGYWLTRPEYKLSAEFGQALFPLQSVAVNDSPEVGSLPTPQLSFVSNTPGLTGFLASAHLQSGKNESEAGPIFTATSRTETPSLLYDFVASPEQQGFDPGQTFPSLHIQMRTSRTGGKAVLHKLSLGFQQHIHDVLLPNKVADVRFVRYGRLRFRQSHHHTNVTEWTNAVCENIASGERLTAPALTIEIPTWTIPGQPADAKGMRHVTYLFSGVQFRQTVSGTFLGAQASYSTMQSGKLVAQGGGMSMHYSGTGQSTQTLFQDTDSLKSFVKKSFSLVDTLTEGATQSQPVSKMLRPRYDTSERKARRSAEGSEGKIKRLAEESHRNIKKLEEEARRLVPDRSILEEGIAVVPERQNIADTTIEAAEATEQRSEVEHSRAEDTPDSHMTGVDAPEITEDPSQRLDEPPEERSTLKPSS